jgi:hypothetical protein
MPRCSSPCNRLSAAALVSATARIAPISWRRSGSSALVRTSTSTKACRVRVLPVPGGPCSRAGGAGRTSSGGR